MSRDGLRGRVVEGAGEDAPMQGRKSCALVVPIDHASDGALDSEEPDGLAFEPGLPPEAEAEGVQIGVGQPSL